MPIARGDSRYRLMTARSMGKDGNRIKRLTTDASEQTIHLLLRS
jgi:hypothetical protein